MESQYLVSAKKRRRLERSWTEAFRTVVLPLIDEEMFRACFDQDNGCPNASIRMLVGLHLLKEVDELTDAQVLDALKFNIQWQYAVEVTPADGSQGQPILVNAFADECVGTARQLGDPRIEDTVTGEHMDAAKEKLILSRTTHLDSLAQRLRDARLAPILQAVLLGDGQIDYESDDFQYAMDLGLVRRGVGWAGPASPDGRLPEVVARERRHRERPRQRRLPRSHHPSRLHGLSTAARERGRPSFARLRGRHRAVRQRDSAESVRRDGIAQLVRYLERVGRDEG